MDGQFLMTFAIAAGAAAASPLGGVLAIALPMSTLLLSLSVGMAGGILMGTLAFEMLPTALESVALGWVIAGFAIGFGLVYALDLYVNRGAVAGPDADQRPRVDALHRRRKPRGTEVTVLAGATSAEELIEGLTIGVGAAIDVRLALVVGLAICIDNVSEALSIGALARAEDGRNYRRRTMFWTGAIGLSLFVSCAAGWFALRSLPPPVLAVLLATGGGAMFYLTVTDLLPDAEQRQYQQSSAIASGMGFLVAFALANFG